ncbi:MAG: NAD(P)H-dependent glycerol-3-phosphate dehydrogenase [Fusobacteriaceae bacterium]
MKKVVIIGSGSWGTALGLILAKNGHEVTMWEWNLEQAQNLRNDKENKKYLPGMKFPENIKIESNVEKVLENAKMVVFSVPSQVLREVVKKFSSQIKEDMILVNTAKGLEISTGKRLSEVIKDEVFGKFHKNIVVLSGPTHAEEVASGVPTAIVAVGDLQVAKEVQGYFNNKSFRVYSGKDIIGAEIGGAVKNCLAIGSGIADGIGYGDNTKAALMTRGLAEMIKYGMALGAEEKTFSGLTGIGDLIVTCGSQHSRNRYVGEKLGKGQKLKDILSEMIMVAEGVPTVKAVYESAKKIGVEMPIVKGIYEVLYEEAEPKDVVATLMMRDLKEEF